MSTMSFRLETRQGSTQLTVPDAPVYAIGYSGRNMEKTMEHIRELEEKLGVPAPKQIPTIFRCGNYLLVGNNTHAVIGDQTSGEAEYVIVRIGGKVYVGLGSDHTDRKLEAVSIAKSKQVCPKPIADILWDYEEVKDHWDRIELRSWQEKDGSKLLYQQGTLGDILPPEKIQSVLSERIQEKGDCIVFSGTLPLLDGFCFGERFTSEMHDPILRRSIHLDYYIEAVEENAQ